MLKLAFTEKTVYTMSPGAGITACIIDIYNERVEYAGSMFRPR